MTMWEINEAAKVITESIDKEARLIFGAVHDERLKKGELKITVIATGFGGPVPKGPVEPKKVIPAGSLPKPALSPAPVAASSPAVREGDEEDWGAVPAFLRRRK